MSHMCACVHTPVSSRCARVLAHEHCMFMCERGGGALTLALVGAVGRRWLPRPLVEAAAAALTGSPAGVVLAGTLQPGGTGCRAQATWA